MRIESNATYIPPVRLMYPTKGVLFTVDSNDPVMAVQETYGRNCEGTGDHRYQVLTIPRGNDLYAFWTDLGSSEDFKFDVEGTSYQMPPYHQIVLMEHSVAECQYMAEQGRDDDFAARLLHEQINESDLFEQYARLIEEDMYIVRNRSTYGVGGVTQRSGYSRSR